MNASLSVSNSLGQILLKIGGVLRAQVTVGECGLNFNIETDDPDELDIDLYHDMTLKDLVYLFVDEGLFGDIPLRLAPYIDYDAIARDLACDYAEVRIAGESYVYRMG